MTEPQTTSTQTPAPKPTNWKRAVAIRFLVRVVALVTLYLLGKYLLPWKQWSNNYINWVERFPNQGVSVLIFGCMAVPFCGFTPGSYAPTVLAGATFPLWVAFLLSYVVMNLAALFNLLFVRTCLARCAKRVFRKRLSTMDQLEAMLAKHPVRTVVLLRIPYLSAGILNYAFSLSTLRVPDYMIGNAIGLLPGSILFALLGQQVRSLSAVILQGETDVTAIVVVVLVFLAVVCAIVGVMVLARRVSGPTSATAPGGDATALGEQANQSINENEIAPLPEDLSFSDLLADGVHWRVSDNTPAHSAATPAATPADSAAQSSTSQTITLTVDSASSSVPSDTLLSTTSLTDKPKEPGCEHALQLSSSTSAPAVAVAGSVSAATVLTAVYA